MRKTLNENSNVPRLAEEIVEKCNLIHPTKLPLVENLLYDLQRRQVCPRVVRLTHLDQPQLLTKYIVLATLDHRGFTRRLPKRCRAAAQAGGEEKTDY